MWDIPARYGVHTPQELAEQLVAQLAGKSFFAQAADRRIHRFVASKDMKGRVADLHTIRGRPCHEIWLDGTLTMFQEEWWGAGIGHELGHTFAWEWDGTGWQRAWPYEETEEKFCSMFEEMWWEAMRDDPVLRRLLSILRAEGELWVYAG